MNSEIVCWPMILSAFLYKKEYKRGTPDFLSLLVIILLKMVAGDHKGVDLQIFMCCFSFLLFVESVLQENVLLVAK